MMFFVMVGQALFAGPDRGHDPIVPAQGELVAMDVKAVNGLHHFDRQRLDVGGLVTRHGEDRAVVVDHVHRIRRDGK